ncbi:glycogen/starch synthase [Urechidicola croceus]|uniref:starch synthase n=1 Tax=Urechidicola croceus TaxID=1850246 RepID=A0A1D8P8Y2_9FLAO|nr:glycogen/starch synthase [Urechidicola croceus]AOW21022.1 glycogen synthase [Urechidicola croceus]
MKDKRVLCVSSEVVPYLPETEMAKLSFDSARMVHSKGGQTRIFMPRFGLINERRHQLHEVIRLSGMNMIINDMDMPLIIKVASIPKERMQVYFIDNDEYFKRKATFTDDKGNLFDDNDERMIFFAKGIVETVKKLNWAPDIIHVHGWMASLLPIYLKEYYKDDALFMNSKIVTSLYNNNFEGTLNQELINKVSFDNIEEAKLSSIKEPIHANLLKIAIENSDAIIVASEDISEDLIDYAKSLDKPVLDFCQIDEFQEAYLNFYETEVLK